MRPPLPGADESRLTPGGSPRAAAGGGSLRGGGGAVLEEVPRVEEIISRGAALDIGKAEVVCCVRVPHEGKPGRRLANRLVGHPARLLEDPHPQRRDHRLAHHHPQRSTSCGLTDNALGCLC